MKIKICGIRTLNDVALMNYYNPDFIGFIFFPKSKRYISLEQARELKDALKSNIKAVGVFVNEDINSVIHYFKQNVIDLVQLHGNEDQDYINILKNNNIPVIKAIRIKDPTDLKLTELFEPDYFLFDVKSEKFVGGTGETFDWYYLKNYKRDIPYFLAGGINKNNIQKALKTQADVLDISSGVETDFKKDQSKVKELFKIFKQNCEI